MWAQCRVAPAASNATYKGKHVSSHYTQESENVQAVMPTAHLRICPDMSPTTNNMMATKTATRPRMASLDQLLLGKDLSSLSIYVGNGELVVQTANQSA